jgi:hypothetical protein
LSKLVENEKLSRASARSGAAARPTTAITATAAHRVIALNAEGANIRNLTKLNITIGSAARASRQQKRRGRDIGKAAPETIFISENTG